MRAPENEATESRGISGVMGAFQEIRWGPIENPKHDLGTDLFVQVRDGRRFDRGLVVGVQVKAGQSHFRRPKRDTCGEVVGWWYPEEDGDHFDYWVRHAIPHLLVLYDLDTGISYWVQVTAQAVVSTGQGNKILVPEDQTIDKAHLDELVEIAGTLKVPPPLEGSVWTASAEDLAPGQLYRYALLAPRLVRPHAANGRTGQINAAEAVALLADGRVRDLTTRAASPDNDVPDPSTVHHSADWGWRLVGALWHWFVNDDRSHLDMVHADASDSPRRTAAAICRACALVDEDQISSGLAVLDSEIERDEAKPVDWAWLQVQRGRLHLEQGELELARHDALEAKRTLVGDADDVSSSAIGAAASTLLWETLRWPSEGIADVIRSNDTAISWWRAQTVSAALEEASDRAFDSWSDDRSVHFRFEDSLRNGLNAACLGAHLAGDQSRWRGLLSLLGRHQLMGAQSNGDSSLITEGFDDLRRSGDTKAIGKATRHLRRVGPLADLRGAVERINEDSWSYTSARGNLEIWKIAGDLLGTDQASWAVQFCIETLTEGDESCLGRLNLRSDLRNATLSAVGGLIAAANDEASRATLRYVATLPDDIGNNAAELHHVLRSLRVETFDDRELDSLRSFSSRVTNASLSAAALERLLAVGDVQANAQLLERARAGDLAAFGALNDLTALDEEYVPRIIDVLEPKVVATTTNARNGQQSVGTFDAAAALAVLNAAFPSTARWDALFDLLAEPSVLPMDKVKACWQLVKHAHRLRDDVKARLVQNLDAIAATHRPVHPLLADGVTSTVGAVESLAIVLDAGNDDAIAARLANHALAGWEERRDLARTLGSGGPVELTGVLPALAGDGHPDVRAAAGEAAAKRIANGIGGPIEHAVAERLLASDGTLSVMSVLRGLHFASQSTTEISEEWLTGLDNHPSAIVRASTRVVRVRLEDHGET